MNYLKYFVIGFLLFTSCQAQDKSKTISSTESGSRIEVIDFHTTHRCKTCLKIEDNTQKLLKSEFKNEMDTGKLSFKIINIDDESNYKMAERFEAAGTALFINIIKDGQEEHIDLTNFAFMKAFDEDEFNTELKSQISEHLNTL